MYVSITRIPYPVYPIIPYPVSHYPVSRGIPIPVSRIPLSLVEGQALRNAGLGPRSRPTTVQRQENGGANSLQQPQESSALQQQFGPRADGALNDDEAGDVHQPLSRVLSGAEAAPASRPE